MSYVVTWQDIGSSTKKAPADLDPPSEPWDSWRLHSWHVTNSDTMGATLICIWEALGS